MPNAMVLLKLIVLGESKVVLLDCKNCLVIPVYREIVLLGCETNYKNKLGLSSDQAGLARAAKLFALKLKLLFKYYLQC